MRRLATVGLSVVALLIASCGGSGDGDDNNGDQTPSASETDGEDPPAESAPAPALKAFDGDVAYNKPVTLEVKDGTVESAEVATKKGAALSGSVADGVWVSDSPPKPGKTYEAAVVAADRDGEEHELDTSFGVAEVPDSNRLTLAMQPSADSVVGVAAPIVVQFDQKVTEKAAVEKHMTVSSSTPVVGSWHWVNDTEARFRPKEYWPAGTDVALDLDLNGVKAGDGLWGGRSYQLKFAIGQSRIAKVDAASHSMALVVDGETQAMWDTSLGAPKFATRNGTYVVLEKKRVKNMTSCGANITCDKGDKDYYDLDVDYSVRLTYSGTFVHAAPWSEGSQGNSNVSHGCLNLSEKNGATFFENARYGDVVTVVNSTRDAGDLVQRGDPGMVDWNQSWDAYTAGSALDGAVETKKL